jgi:hypothetical protein
MDALVHQSHGPGIIPPHSSGGIAVSSQIRLSSVDRVSIQATVTTWSTTLISQHEQAERPGASAGRGIADG